MSHGLRIGSSPRRVVISVGAEKQGREKCTYQHPELYGLSAEMGMNYTAPAEYAD